MLLVIKTLQQTTFNIDIDITEKVSVLKQKIFEAQGDAYSPDDQRLIYSGKILINDQLLSSYNILETNFIVVMVTKKAKKSDEPTPAVSQPKKEPTKEVVKEKEEPKPPAPPKDENKSVSPVPASTSSSTPTDTLNVENRQEADQNLLVTGNTYNEAVNELMAMGFEQDLVTRALRASFNNPNRAVEYLLNGMPEGFDALPIGSNPESSETPPTASTDSQSSDISFIRNQPQFIQMRQLIQQDPNLLQTFLEQIRTSNPQLLQLITQNQERFVQMLNEPDVETDQINAEASSGPPSPSQVPNISISPEEKLAIERLKALGFPEVMCLQAYFACEKNEELAANFLLSQNFD